MSDWVDKVRRNPKIVATVVFVVLVTVMMFTIGYNTYKKKDHDKSGAVKHGMIWVGASYGVIILLSLIVMIVFGTDFWTFMLVGGDLVSLLLQGIAALIDAMAN